MTKSTTLGNLLSASPYAEMRTSGQLALLAGAYACANGCGVVVLVAVHQPLPWCSRCHRRTAWLRQREPVPVPIRIEAEIPENTAADGPVDPDRGNDGSR